MLIEALLLTFLLIGYGLFNFMNKLNYWKKLGVPSPSTKYQLTSICKFFAKKWTLHDAKKEEYRMFEGERFYGTFNGSQNILVFRDDFHLLRSIMIKDFDHFSRGIGGAFVVNDPANYVEEIQMKGLTVIDGDEWKAVRSTFSPIFSSGKLKKMTHLIRALNNKIEDTLGEYASSGQPFNLKDEMGKYSLDAISSCGFGVDAGSLGKKEDSEFAKNVKRVFDLTLSRVFMFFFILPVFARSQTLSLLRKFLVQTGIAPFLRFPSPDENLFFIKVVESAIKQRRETKTKRNDLIDMMIEALDSPLFCGEDDDEHVNQQFERDSKIKPSDKSKVVLNEDYIIATAIVLLMAGYDTTALTMSNAVFMLTLNPECQRRLQEELDEADTNDYTTLQSLPYLDAVIHETLRMHPVVSNLPKICTKPYKIPGTSVVLKPGDMIEINAVGIAHDPKYFPNPETFDPENFMKAKKTERDPLTFLGFNQGPRACIAMRFALLEMKICLSHLLKNFNFLSCEKTSRNYEIDVDNFLGGIKGGAWVRCERR